MAAIIATVFHQNNVDETANTLKAEMGEPHTSLSYYQERDTSDGKIYWKKGVARLREFDSLMAFPDVNKTPTGLPWYIISEKRLDRDGLIHWSPHSAIKKVNDIETWCIAISALVGTVLWAFGNNNC